MAHGEDPHDLPLLLLLVPGTRRDGACGGCLQLSPVIDLMLTQVESAAGVTSDKTLEAGGGSAQPADRSPSTRLTLKAMS